VAGVLSFLSPCVLPLVPGYISFLSGLSMEELKKTEEKSALVKKTGVLSVFFVLGFSLVFMVLGASATFVGRLLSEHIEVLSRIAGIVIIALGLHLTGILNIKALYYEKKIHVGKVNPGYAGAFLVGAAFAFGWTPCIGPILAGILALAATKDTMGEGITLLGSYSLGLGIPFIVTGFAVGLFMKFFEKYRKFIRWGEIAAGVFLIAVGILIFSNNLDVLLKYVPESFYDLSK